MKISLQNWNALLLGPVALAATYLSGSGAKTDPVGRAVAFGIIFYLSIPVAVLLIVDSMKIYQYFKKRTDTE